jgi:transcriptional regulator with XRE-family HTH domain
VTAAANGRAFGSELDQLRQKRGLSYRQLGERAGCSPTYLVDLARGNRGARPSPDLVVRIAAALEVDPDAFACYRQHVVLTRAPHLVDQAYHQLVGQ